MSLVCTRSLNNQVVLIPNFIPESVAALSLPALPAIEQIYSAAYRIVTQQTFFEVTQQIDVDVLLVGAGGGGGQGHHGYGAGGAGGGAGKVVTRRITLLPGRYEVVVGSPGTNNNVSTFNGTDGRLSSLKNLTLNQVLLQAAPGLGGGSGYMTSSTAFDGGQGGGSGGGACGAHGGNRGGSGGTNATNPSHAPGGAGGGWDDALGILSSLSTMFVFGSGGVANSTSLYDGGGGGGGLRLIDPSVGEQTAGSGTRSDNSYSGTPGTGGKGFGAGGGGGTATTGNGGIGVQGLCVLLFRS
jgi:hypothetical protein